MNKLYLSCNRAIAIIAQAYHHVLLSLIAIEPQKMHSLCGMSTQFFHYTPQYHRSQEVTSILGIHCCREEKDLPNPLTSFLLFAGVESPAGIEGPDPSMKAQECFVIYFIRTNTSTWCNSFSL